MHIADVTRGNIGANGIGGGDMMTMVLACDHRAVDGTYAAQFLGRVRQQLENPASLEG